MTPYVQTLQEARELFATLDNLEPQLKAATELCLTALRHGHKLLVCGNGGSACEAQHLVGELVGRYKKNRRALPAIALTADGATLSCIGNDYRFEEVFSRQIEALGQPGDVLIVFSSSGQSPNLVEALKRAQQLGLPSVAFLGKDGGPALPLADCVCLVPHSATARVQEAHQFLLHTLMDAIESGLGLG